MMGQAWLFSRAQGRWRTALWIVCGLFAVWNVYLFVLYRSSAISRGDPVTWVEMFRAVKDLPGHVSLE